MGQFSNLTLPAAAALLASSLAMLLVGCGGSGQSSSADAGATQTAVAHATATAIAAIPTTFVSVPQTVTPSEKAQITVHTKPRARCDIAIEYKSDASHPEQPGAQRADNDGNVSWSWTVNPQASPGPAAAIVNCDYDVLQTSFTVT